MSTWPDQKASLKKSSSNIGMGVKSIIWYESIRVALRHVKTHPLRTFLTIIGFTVGLAALLAMVGIGEGTRRKVIRDMERLGGAGVIIIQVHEQFLNNPEYLYSKENKLSKADLEAIGRASSHINLLAPTIFKPGSFIFQKNRFRGHFLGTTHTFDGIRNLQLKQGRFLTRIDVEQENHVCVIGSDVQDELFGDANSIGKKIRFGTNEFTVIGVIADQTIESGRMINEYVILPITITKKLISDYTSYSQIFVKVENIELVTIVKDQIVGVLEERHENSRNFRVFSQSDVIENLLQSSLLLSFIFGTISFIILFVGGIGIMNLMLVSVTERTKEIGIHKAVGAKDSDIFRLFLFEAVIISFLGGGAGVILGVNGGKLITFIIELLLQNKIESIISVKIILLALVFSIMTGIFFGLYPALKAARVDPSRALSYE